MRFEKLQLAEPILRAVAAEGYTTPTPIQIQAIPVVLAGSDLLGCAQTGSGKTAGFALPILQRLGQEASHPAATNGRRPHGKVRALVICPTRELCCQITQSFRAYGRYLHLRYASVYGGVGQNLQVKALKAGVDVLIATPGRLLDLMGQGHVDLRSIEVLVLDEADRMLDMGFIRDIRRIIEQLPKRRQTLLFSATMPPDIRRLADSILNEPVSVHVDPEAPTVETVSQQVCFVAKRNKPALLEHLLQKMGANRTLVFTRTKHGADRVVRGLRKAGIAAQALHSNKSQPARIKALEGFRSGKPAVLVATDIASRGIDIDDIAHVINFDVPNIAETYVHRIGRTARAGAAGLAVSFCDYDEQDSLRAIEQLIGMHIEVNADHPHHQKTAQRPARGRSQVRAPRRGDAGSKPGATEHAHVTDRANGVPTTPARRPGFLTRRQRPVRRR
jgi:ATP-dependent RNA helicase RhlE